MKKSRVKIILKSGYAFSMVCDDFTVKHQNGEITGFSYTGATIPRPLFIRVGDISAVIEEGAVSDEHEQAEATT